MIDGSKVWFAGLAKVALFNGHLGRGDWTRVLADRPPGA